MQRLSLTAGLGLVAALLVVAMLRVPLPGAKAATAATMFSDDFEDGNATGWTIVGGTWSVVTDGSYVYSQTAIGSRTRASAGSSAWTDYAVTAKIKPVYLPIGSNYYVALGARYQSSADFYFLDMRTDRVEIRSFIGNSSAVLSYTNYTVTPGTWYTVTLEVNGNTLKGYINGALLLTATDSAFSTGAIALSTYQASAEFDDVLVTTPTPVVQTLTVTRTGTGSGSVSSAPAGIDCGVTCTASFDSGTVVTLTATPEAGSTFIGWTGACVGAGKCVVTMSAAKSVAAVFSSDIRPMLFVDKDGNGHGSVTSDPVGIDCSAACSAGFDVGVVATLTATPAAGSTFTGWSGAECSGADACIVTMNVAKTVTATFGLMTHTLRVSVTGEGSGLVASVPAGINCGTSSSGDGVTCTASFDYGTIVTLTATTGPASAFAGWAGAGCNGTGSCVVTMDAYKIVTATFNKTFALYLPIIMNGNGVAPPTGDALYVTPNGSDSAPGTISDPTTLTSAITRVQTGGIIYMRGGTYSFSTPVIIARGNDGAASAHKQLFAYPGETPLLNFAAMATDPANRGLTVNGFYWHVKGLIVEWAGDNGIFVGGSYNIIERCVTRYNRDTGLQLSRYSSSAPESEWPAYNLILSCESHDNKDATGENADGFAAKLTSGDGNVFRYCVSHNNSDDGWDLYTKTDTGAIGPVTIEDSISYQNGTLSDGTTTSSGDRNGFKLGGEDIAVDHIIRRNLAYKNGKHGFTWNRNTGSIAMTSNVAVDNDTSQRNFNFDGGASVFRNNVSCRFISGSNDRIIGDDDGSNSWWMGANGAACASYSGTFSWWFNPDGSLEYKFQ